MSDGPLRTVPKTEYCRLILSMPHKTKPPNALCLSKPIILYIQRLMKKHLLGYRFCNTSLIHCQVFHNQRCRTNWIGIVFHG